MTTSQRVLRASGLLNGTILALAVGLLAARNLGNRHFWTDESSTFLSALGWPGVGEEPRGAADVLDQLKYYFDPGTFHFLVRLWFEIFGGGIEALRALPFMFFLLYLSGLLVWYRLVRVPLTLAIAGTSIVLLDQLTLYYAFELRPYSASLAAAVVLPAFAVFLVQRPSIARLFAFLVGAVLLGSMQYTEIGLLGATAILLVVALFKAPARRDRIVLGVAASAVVAILPLAFVITRGLPTASLERDLTYVEATVIRQMDLSQIAHTLNLNFFSLTALPRTAFLLLVGSVLVIRFVLSRRGRTPGKFATSADGIIFSLWIYILVGTAIAAALSTLGYLPWIVGTRWSITEVGFIALSVVGLIGMGCRLINYSHAGIAVSLGFLSVAMTITGAWRLATYERGGNHQGLEYLAPRLLEGQPGTALIDYWIYPDVRYWLEYSGSYRELTPMWLSQNVQSTFDYKPADARDIADFVKGDYERLLLRSESALKVSGVELPDSVQVVRAPSALAGNVPTDQLPVLLVKK